MKKLIVTILFLLLPLLGVYSQTAVIWETFEGQDFPSEGWTVSNYSKSPVENHTPGGHFAARSGGNMTYDIVYLVSPKIHVQQGDKLYISFWYRRQTGVSNPFMVIRLLGSSSDQVIDSMYVDALMYWFPYNQIVYTLPANDSVRVKIQTNTYQGSGRFFIDDIYISKTPALSPPPAAPTNLQITQTTTTTLSLGWNDNAINEDGYFIQRRDNPSSVWNTIDTLPFNSNSYLDEGLTPNTSYSYRVICWNPNGFSEYSNIATGSTNFLTGTGSISTAAYEFRLMQNYPNPFNPFTKISFTLPENGYIKLEVFDITGRLTSVPFEGYRSSGAYSIEFDGTGLNSGIYFYRLTSDKHSSIRKMTLIK